MHIFNTILIYFQCKIKIFENSEKFFKKVLTNQNKYVILYSERARQTANTHATLFQYYNNLCVERR